jgi:hypothetical protein
MRIEGAVLVGSALLLGLTVCAPAVRVGVAKEATKPYVDPRGRFAFDYPAACSISTVAGRIEIGDPNGPDLFLEPEEVSLVQSSRDSTKGKQLTQYMYDWVNNNHFADGPEGSIHADSIRMSRRFTTDHGLPVYEWSLELISESWPVAGGDDAAADSTAALEPDSVAVSGRPGTPVFAVDCSRPGHMVVVWVAVTVWTGGGPDTRTMRSIASSFRRP